MKVIKFIKEHNNYKIGDIITIIDKNAFHLVKIRKAAFVNHRDYLMKPENPSIEIETRAFRRSPKIS